MLLQFLLIFRLENCPLIHSTFWYDILNLQKGKQNWKSEIMQGIKDMILQIYILP
jgi:hypothetical protein